MEPDYHIANKVEVDAEGCSQFQVKELVAHQAQHCLRCLICCTRNEDALFCYKAPQKVLMILDYIKGGNGWHCCCIRPSKSRFKEALRKHTFCGESR